MSNFFMGTYYPLRPIKSLVNINYGKGLAAKVRDEKGKVPVYGSNGIIGYHSESITKSPVIIIGRKGSVGAVNFSSTSCWPIDTSFFIDEYPDNLDPKWLYYCLTSLEFGIHAQGPKPGIKRDLLYQTEIPVPPLGEQRRIVARIEELTRRAEEARRFRQEAIKGIERSLAATVDALFHERDNDWTEATVKQLCGRPQYGYTASASNEQIGPRFLRITDIQNGQVDWDSVPYCPCDEPEKCRLSDGDIVFARTGATTGKSYLVRNPPDSVFASYLIRIRPCEHVLPEYIWWYFQSSSYWAAVYSGIDDGNRPNMNGSKLGALKIPFPKSKKTQMQIVSRLETLGEKIAELRELQTISEVKLSAFQSALLAKAFRGEL
ncbi:MAG: restriction endonuclease subunit S [Deltaproteobacteria bacterium]|nr:restriction endonuclease subunit S [Deltaproteobacteria bacterium]MBW1967521.1 restriction endonuclease subunit S [Deltaproteobacteria bacterium]